MQYSTVDILQQLESAYLFPSLDNGYFALADTRLIAYRSNGHWGLVIELLGCSSTDSAHEAIRDVLYVFGSCLRHPPGTNAAYFMLRTSDGPKGPTFTGLSGPEFQAVVFPDAKTIRIRHQVVPITTDPADYAVADIALHSPPNIWNYELLRWMAPRYRSLLLCTDDELQMGFTEPLQDFMLLNEWRHPDLTAGEKPSDLESFRSLVEALATGDPCRYQPSEPPNTHWSNWPMGGML